MILIDDFAFPFIDTADSHGFRSEMASEYTAFFNCLREHEDRLRFLLMTGTTRCITTGFDWVFRGLLTSRLTRTQVTSSALRAKILKPLFCRRFNGRRKRQA